MRFNQTIQSVFNASFNSADTQSNGASGVGGRDTDIPRLNNNDCTKSAAGQQLDTHNVQLGSHDGGGGCSGIREALDTSITDYMSDAFGDLLCLNPMGCANGTTPAGPPSGDQNMTHLLADSEEEPFLNYCMNRAGNISYLNISCEFELEYATPLYGFCIPILLFVTVSANLLIVLVLSRRNMATPTNSVLMGESSAIISVCVFDRLPQ